MANIGAYSGKYKVMIGPSRKSFLKDLLGQPPEERLAGSLAAAVYASQNGVDIIRVHDVQETVSALKVIRSLSERKRVYV